MTATHESIGSQTKRLALVLAALLVLTAVTVAVSRVDVGALNIFVALAVASVKATLVLLFFMELRDAGRLVVISFVGTVFALALLIAFLFFDVAYR